MICFVLFYETVIFLIQTKDYYIKDIKKRLKINI